MRTLVDDEAWVHYGQIYVQGEQDFGGLSECFGGQDNGLCGAASPGTLYLITGLHTGRVGFTVELHDQAPPLDDTWEEIVEVSFHPEGDTALVGWGGEGFWPLDLRESDYRVRYCAIRMDEARELDTRMDEETQVDRYLLQFWPAPPGPDRVLRQTSAAANYWHGFAREQPPPPTPEEKAEVERRVALEREREREQARIRYEEWEWGGHLPGERLRRLGGSAKSVAKLDRPLVDTLAEVDPATQREIARWVTRRVFVEAQLDDVGWIAPALEAMDRGEPLPEPFDDDRKAWERLLSDERVPRTTTTSLDGRHDNYLQQAMAFPALFSARDEDPLCATFGALWAGAVAFGYGRHGVLFGEVRQAFPAIAEHES
ncbi:hypothetical protein [Saccharopolyspora spinosa]|uniref:Uncharacterized protein n=1 Tax=Saccharopolyspora spinosa TaxID=60894 RepID=A0A2N3XR26_SACSN|nr:hypothetical protein [Saccharopolyspora spinosa]PKW13115.1 hypothetical protein A8926_0621 [Saccharopolyspora spinosa]